MKIFRLCILSVFIFLSLGLKATERIDQEPLSFPIFVSVAGLVFHANSNTVASTRDTLRLVGYLPDPFSPYKGGLANTLIRNFSSIERGLMDEVVEYAVVTKTSVTLYLRKASQDDLEKIEFQSLADLETYLSKTRWAILRFAPHAEIVTVLYLHLVDIESSNEGLSALKKIIDNKSASHANHDLLSKRFVLLDDGTVKMELDFGTYDGDLMPFDMPRMVIKSITLGSIPMVASTELFSCFDFLK